MSNGTRLIAVVVVVVLAAIGLYYAFLYSPPGTSNVPVPVNTNLVPDSVTPPAPPAGGLGDSHSGVAGGEATHPESTRTVTPPPAGAFGPPTGAAGSTTGGAGAPTGTGNPVPVGSSTPATRDNAPLNSTTEYTIQKGDTLEGLARKFFGDATKWRAIQDANPGLDATKLQLGQKIRIPAAPAVGTSNTGSNSGSGSSANTGANTYTVVQGDSLSSIARKVYGSDANWKKILEANSALLKGNANAIQPGMKLAIPPKTR